MIAIAPFGKSMTLPLEITAQSRKPSTSFGQVFPVGSGRPMLKEQRLLLCVALQAVAEQDERNTVSDHAGKRGAKEKAKISAEARRYVASDEFEGLCAETGLSNLCELLRDANPDKAQLALEYLSNPNTDMQAALTAVLAMRGQTLPASGVEEAAA